MSDWAFVFAIVTLALAGLAIAIWGPDLRGLTSRPRLIVSVQPGAPRFQKIWQAAGSAGATRDTYWARIVVGNASRTAATNVEVRMLRLFRQTQSGTFASDDDFLPISLLWARGHNVTTRVVHQDLPKYIDLLLIEKPNLGEEPRFRFQTEVVPNPVRPGVWPTIKDAGVYHLDLAATSAE